LGAVLRTFVPTREEVTGGWRELHNEESHFYSSSENIIRMFKSRKMRWVEHITCIRKMTNEYKYFGGKALEDLRTLSIAGRI
jgi:hypothetical protein